MSRPKSNNIVVNSEVARLVTEMCNASAKTQKQIAEEIGLSGTNIITMFKSGRTKFPLNRVKSFAAVVGGDADLLLLTVLKEYDPEAYDLVAPHMPRVSII